MKLSKRKLIFIAFLIIMVFLLAELIFRPRIFSQSLASSLYKMKSYGLPEKIFAANAAKDDDLAAANLAKVKYRQGNYSEAIEAEDSALEAKPSDPVRNYDAGNAAYRSQDYETALQHFRKAMLNDPHDLDAKANYELSQKKMQQQPKPKPQPQPQPKPDQQKEEDIRNILGGLDSKESSDRKQNQGQGAAGGDKWW